MSSSNSPTLVFEPHWSIQRWGLVLMQVAICLIVPWLIPYWYASASLALCVIAMSMVATGCYRAGWWGARRVVRVTWQQSGQWLLERAHDRVAFGEQCWTTLTADSYVSQWLLVLRWHEGNSSACLLILPGELPATSWRQWQARLRLEAGRPAAVAIDV